MRAAVVGTEPQEPPVRVMDVPSPTPEATGSSYAWNAPAPTASTP
jgi:hypothetical protein